MGTCWLAVRDGRRCSRSIVYTVESFEDGVITRLFCCAQHKPKAIREVFDQQTHFGHGQRTRCANDHINSIVVTVKSGETETHHLGTVGFGPITERTHLEELYEQYFEERARIGMFGLHLEDSKWRARYDECDHSMREIEQRLACLP